MIIGYLDTSGKNIAVDKQQQQIKQYASDNRISIDVYISDDVDTLIANLQTMGHKIIVSNIAAFGNSLRKIWRCLDTLVNSGNTVVCIKEQVEFSPNKECLLLLKGIEMSIEFRKSMVSTITGNILETKRSNGQKLGRAFGSRNRYRVWTGKEETIKSLISAGFSREEVAKEVGISIVSLYNYLKLHPEAKGKNKEN